MSTLFVRNSKVRRRSLRDGEGFGQEYFVRRRSQNFTTLARYVLLLQNIYLRHSNPSRKSRRRLAPIRSFSLRSKLRMGRDSNPRYDFTRIAS